MACHHRKHWGCLRKHFQKKLEMHKVSLLLKGIYTTKHKLMMHYEGYLTAVFDFKRANIRIYVYILMLFIFLFHVTSSKYTC